MSGTVHQLFPLIEINTDTGVQNSSGSWDYTVKLKDGSVVPLSSSSIFSPDEIKGKINDSGSEVYDNLSALLRNVDSPTEGDRGIVQETILPALTRVPGIALGSLADIGNAALSLPDAGINFLDWAFDGFEGDIPKTRYLSSKPEDVALGSVQLNKAMEYVGEVARKTDKYLDKNMGTFTIPGTTVEVAPDLGLTDLVLGSLKFNTTPDESTKARKYVSLITQVIGAAPVEGALIAKLALQLAKGTANPTANRVYEALSEMQQKNPLKAAAIETALGAASGTGMVTSLDLLESQYPDAPEWMKNIVMAGGGIIFPMAAATVGSVAASAAPATPIIKYAVKAGQGLMESLTPKGADRAATRAVSTMGGDFKNRFQVLGVLDQFMLAVKEGRLMDPATRLAYTTPQLLRSEANLLEFKLNVAAKDMTAEEVQTQRDLIQDMRQYSNFQEGQLKTVSTSKGIGAAAYAQYSDRLMDRRDSIFDALNKDILKLESEGSKLSFDEAADKITGLDAGPSVKQTQAISTAYENTLSKIDTASKESLADALEKVEAYKKQAPEKMSEEERFAFNLTIRRELEASYTEIDRYEDILWNNIRGLDVPKTKPYVDPEGTDKGPEILVDGVPIGEHFAAKQADLKAGEAENQSKWLWKLSGRDEIVKQDTKGGGPDAEKAAKQNLIVKNQESIVAERQRELDVANENLSQLGRAEFNDPKVVAARAEVARLEAELKQIPTGQTIEDTTVIRRLNAASQKLTGARAKLEELSKQPVENPSLKRSEDAFEKAQSRLNESQIKLDLARGNLDISMVKGVDDQGTPVNLSDEVLDTSALGVRTVDGVPVGREAQELQNVISLLKAEMSFEQGRINRKPAKVVAIGEIIDDLQRAISDPDNFSVDTVALDAARKMTSTKKTLFEKGVVGDIRRKTSTNESKVEIENTIDKIATPTKQETNLRQIESALTAISTGEGTPFRMVPREDGTVSPEFDPNFNLQGYADAPPPPFTSIDVNGGRSIGLKVSEGTQPTAVNIDIVQKTLWERFTKFSSGEEFNSTAASTWIENNGAAIRWLKNATGKETGFQDLVSAERVARSVAGAKRKNIDSTVEVLTKNNAFNEEFTEKGFRELNKESDVRDSNMNSAALFLDNPQPLTMGEKFLSEYSKNPGTLNETLKVLDNGLLPDGNNPALQGFKQAVGEALLKEAITKPGATKTKADKQAAKLTANNQLNEVRLWDPQKLSGLSQSPMIKKLLLDLYGPDAPKLFQEIAEGARLQSFIGESATPNVSRQDRVSDEVAGNFGRMIGGALATYTPVSSLVLTGVGRRYGVQLVTNIRGSVIDTLIVDFLMNPQLMSAALERWPMAGPAVPGSGFRKLVNKAKLLAHKKFIDDNAKRIERLGETPGVLFELGKGNLQENQENDEEYSIGEQSSVQPVSSPARRFAQNMPAQRAPVEGSVLSQTSPTAYAPTGQSSQETLAGLSQLGMPLFAAHGGYISRGSISSSGPMEESGIFSVTRKPKQIVG